MSYRNSPVIQARIFQARQKKQIQLRHTANASFIQGAKAAAVAASELLAEGVSDVYEFDSLVLHHLGLIDAERRVLRGSDTEKAHEDLLEHAKAMLSAKAPTEDQFVSASISNGRSAYETWVLHRELTGISRDDLTDERRAKITAAVSQKFPD